MDSDPVLRTASALRDKAVSSADANVARLTVGCRQAAKQAGARRSRLMGSPKSERLSSCFRVTVKARCSEPIDRPDGAAPHARSGSGTLPCAVDLLQAHFGPCDAPIGTAAAAHPRLSALQRECTYELGSGFADSFVQALSVNLCGSTSQPSALAGVRA